VAIPWSAVDLARIAWLLLPAVATLALVADDGGVQSTSWYPWALVLTLVAGGAMALGVVRIPFGPGGIAAACFGGLAALTIASTAWALLPGSAFTEGARTLFYAALFVIACGAVRGRRDAAIAFAGIAAAGGLVAVIAAIRLATGAPGVWFYADRFAWPTGYPNTAAALFLLAVWPLCGLAAARPLHPVWRGLAQGAAVLAFGVGFLSESRGATFAFLIATPVVFALVRERLRLAVPVLVTAAGMLIIAKPVRDALQTGPSPAARSMARDLLAVALAAVLVGVAIALVDRRLVLDSRRRGLVGRAALAVTIAAVVIGGAVAIAAHVPHRIQTSWHTFTQVNGSDTSSLHLFASNSNRYDYWRVALDDFGRHPLNGVGAGGFAPTYLIHGRSTEAPAQAHGEVWELLATLGLPGLLLALGVAVPALAGLLGRFGPRDDTGPILAGAFGGALSVLLHAQADWHWQATCVAVPLVAMLGTGAALLPTRGTLGRRWAIGAGMATCGLALLWIAPGLIALRLEDQAAQTGDASRARLAARFDRFGSTPLLLASNLEAAEGQRAQALRDARAAAAREPAASLTWIAVAHTATDSAEIARACARAHAEDPRTASCSGGSSR
jgi:O-Antigen ligase